MCYRVRCLIVFRGGYGGEGFEPEVDGVAHTGVLEAEVDGADALGGDAVVARLGALFGVVHVVFELGNGSAVRELLGFRGAGEDVEVAVGFLFAIGLAVVQQLAKDVGIAALGLVERQAEELDLLVLLVHFATELTIAVLVALRGGYTKTVCHIRAAGGHVHRHHRALAARESRLEGRAQRDLVGFLEDVGDLDAAHHLRPEVLGRTRIVRLRNLDIPLIVALEGCHRLGEFDVHISIASGFHFQKVDGGMGDLDGILDGLLVDVCLEGGVTVSVVDLDHDISGCLEVDEEFIALAEVESFGLGRGKQVVVLFQNAFVDKMHVFVKQFAKRHLDGVHLEFLFGEKRFVFLWDCVLVVVELEVAVELVQFVEILRRVAHVEPSHGEGYLFELFVGLVYESRR